jgi:hypothetical protein
VQKRVLGGEGGSRGFFGGSHGKTRTVALIVVAVFGMVATIALQGLGLGLWAGASVVVFLVTIRTHRGSPLVRLQARRRWAERAATGTVVFKPVDTRPPGLDPTTGSRAERKAKTLEWNAYRDWPDGAEGMHWLQRTPGEPGIAWHVPTGEDAYLSVAFGVEGAIRGIESDAFLDLAMKAFGAMLARYGSRSMLPKKVQSLTRTIPVDSAYHEQWVWEQLDPDAVPELIASYDEVVRLTADAGLMQRHYFVVSWPLTAEFMAAARRRGPAQAGWRALMVTEIESVRSHLVSAKLGKVDPLTAAQTAAVLRHMQQPSWPIDQAGDVDVAAPWVASHDELSATITDAVSPDGRPEQWWHRTALLPIESVETGPRSAMWLTPLLSRMSHQIIRTLSVQIEVVPGADARRSARTDVSYDLADLAAQREKGVLTSEDLTAGLTAARARLEDLSPGSGHHGAGWAAHLTISARSRSDLVDATAKITEAAGNAGISSLDWLDTQQAAAAACTWPIARGMRPIAKSTGSTVRGLLAGAGSKEAI